MSTTIMPNLEGRTAHCSCGKTRPSAERAELAFFEYRGEGSPDAARCECGFDESAHDGSTWPSGRRKACDNFCPRGPQDTDSYYCGHGGWD